MRLLAPPVLALALLTAPVVAQEEATDFGEVFDEHWETLRDKYPYFERYGVDWEAERADHRPRAVAAANATEFTWELARLLSVLKDAHTSYMPSVEVMNGWSIPDLRTATMGGKSYVIGWRDARQAGAAPPFGEDPRAYPEILSVQGTSIGSGVEILAAGPVGSTFELRLRWADGHETDERVQRPDVCNVLPPERHFGERWLVHGRVGSIGYLRVRTFSPDRATLGPDGKMTTMLRAALKALGDTDGLILDLQGNGGGQVAASDPFLSNFLTKRQSYKWGNSGGKRRVLNPKSPRYRGEVVALVDERSASGGEWAARILRDAGRATVVGGPTMGAEAAVHESVASDGSTIWYSAWPMVEPGVASIQDVGVELDHAFPMTIEEVREHGYEAALERVRHRRFAKALELLGAPAADLEAFLAIAPDDPLDNEE